MTKDCIGQEHSKRVVHINVNQSESSDNVSDREHESYSRVTHASGKQLNRKGNQTMLLVSSQMLVTNFSISPYSCSPAVLNQTKVIVEDKTEKYVKQMLA